MAPIFKPLIYPPSLESPSFRMIKVKITFFWKPAGRPMGGGYCKETPIN